MRREDMVALAAQLFLMLAARLLQVPAKQQRQGMALGVCGAALVAVKYIFSTASPDRAQLLQAWLPLLQMLLVYWHAGRLYREHGYNEPLQAWLMRFDRRWLGTVLNRWQSDGKNIFAENYFELAYLMCYVEVPAGVGVLCWRNQYGAMGQYWATVMLATCLCYVCVPFAQTLPPRLLATADARSRKQPIRSLNLFIVRHASIHLNTFPSAHVASTVAASLVMLRHVPVAGIAFLLVAGSIAAGAVLGRYHYALDVVFGAAVAVCAAIVLRV